jgi:nucleoside diphosphate kinase
VIKTGRKILGATNPNAADPGTIRGEYCISVGRNLIHGNRMLMRGGINQCQHSAACRDRI